MADKIEKTDKTVARRESGELADIARDSIIPPVDIYEDTDCVTLLADLPGVDKDSLDVHIDKETLRILGKKHPDIESGAERYYNEIPDKNFFRAFTIGEEIDREKISASMNNGVLKLVLPKSEKTKPKKIEIKVT